MSQEPEPGRFSRLPEPVPLDALRTSLDTHPAHEEKDDYWRELEWMLRSSAG